MNSALCANRCEINGSADAALVSSRDADRALVPPGDHKVRVELINPEHQADIEQAVAIAFTVPDPTEESRGRGRTVMHARGRV
jgi:hypothetical protein